MDSLFTLKRNGCLLPPPGTYSESVKYFIQILKTPSHSLLMKGQKWSKKIWVRAELSGPGVSHRQVPACDFFILSIFCKFSFQTISPALTRSRMKVLLYTAVCLLQA